ncbi:MAG: hypothetical protein KF817_08460 [Phycisphaeraceae bacterium]|nr:hypothetical protein [Phycisphaeraceae bacterium]
MSSLHTSRRWSFARTVFLMMAVLPLHAAGAWASGSDDPGPTLRVHGAGILHLRGFAARSEMFAGETRRETDIVLSEVHTTWPASKAGLETAEPAWALARPLAAMWTDLFGAVTSRAETIDLEKGYAYVKMAPEETPLQMSLLDKQVLILADPAKFTPPIMSWLLRQVRLQNEVQAAIPELMVTGLQTFAADPALMALILPGDVPARAPAVMDRHGELIAFDRYWMTHFAHEVNVSVLIDALLSREGTPRETMVRRAMAAMRLASLAAETEDLSRYMALIRYPFILSRRSIGGAEGTEIVIFARSTGTTGKSAEVFYFFLHSDTVEEIEVAAYVLNPFSGVEELLPAPVPVEVCRYARVPLQMKMHDGVEKWFLPNANSITVHDIGTAMPSDLVAVLQHAHRDACLAGIEPESPITCGGLELACPGMPVAPASDPLSP